MSKVLRNFVRGYCRGSMPAAAEHVVPASVYFHWPFCRKRCNYCNFNKYVPGRRGQNMEHVRMTEAMVAEAATLMEIAGVTEVTSVFFGGGTPSLMKPDTVEVQGFYLYLFYCFLFCLLYCQDTSVKSPKSKKRRRGHSGGESERPGRGPGAAEGIC